MSTLLIIAGIFLVLGGLISLYAASVWGRRAKWWAQTAQTTLGAATEGHVVRITGQAVSGASQEEISPISRRAAVVWRVDLFEQANTGQRSGYGQQDIRRGGSLAITDGTGPAAMMSEAAAHLVLSHQEPVATLKAEGGPTRELAAMCRALGMTLRPDKPNWSAQLQERIIAPGTILHAIGCVRRQGQSVRLVAIEGEPESCFAVLEPAMLGARVRKLRWIGAALFVAAVACVVLALL